MNNSRRDIKKKVQQFYDECGWQKHAQDLYADAVLFEDLREVAREYISKCHLRVNRYLPASGKFLLDVASGPLQYPEYRTYSDNFSFRLCVDLSLVALHEARARLGDKGLYVAADLVNLPFKANSIDSAISLHTLYHVPALEQAQAFREIYRVLKPRGRAVIVYNWGRHAHLMTLFSWPVKLGTFPGRAVRFVWRRAAAFLGRGHPGQPGALYFHAHNLRWFEQHIKPEMPYTISVWRSVSVGFLKGYIHAPLWGKDLLQAIYRLEERYPRLLGKMGQYPLFVVEKP
jgi:SAM-dependent methyltransferase